MRTRRHGFPLLVLIALSPAGAQPPALGSAVVDVRFETPERLTVETRYFLEPAGARELELTAFAFDGARAANVRAFLGDHELSFRAHPTSGDRLDGMVELPAAGERLSLRLSYEVLRDTPGNGSLSIPILVASWPPREALPDTFSATVTLPRGTVLRSAFPTDFERVETVDKTTDESVYRVSMPVMPALLRLTTARAGEAGWLTTERAVDLAALVALLALGALGWRRLGEALR